MALLCGLVAGDSCQHPLLWKAATAGMLPHVHVPWTSHTMKKWWSTCRPTSDQHSAQCYGCRAQYAWVRQQQGLSHPSSSIHSSPSCTYLQGEGEPTQLHTEVLHHVCALWLTMYQHIKTHSLLDTNCKCNLLIDQALIVLPAQAAIAQEGAQATDLQGAAAADKAVMTNATL